MRVPAKDRAIHRKMAAECFNKAWDLLDRNDRKEEDDLQMLYLAHASRYHWGLVGTPRNRAVGDWQISRVYVDLRQPQLAVAFAKSCLATCRDYHLSDMMHTADEGVARAYAAGGDFPRAKKYLDASRKRLDKLALDDDERRVYLAQIEDTQKLIRD